MKKIFLLKKFSIYFYNNAKIALKLIKFATMSGNAELIKYILSLNKNNLQISVILNYIYLILKKFQNKIYL